LSFTASFLPCFFLAPPLLLFPSLLLIACLFARPFYILQVFSWDLNASLSKAFDYLSSSVRPFTPAVIAVARNVKAAVARVSPTLSDNDAKQAVISDLTAYQKERISVVEDGLVAEAACRVVTASSTGDDSSFDGLSVKGGDVLLTFGYSSAVETLLKGLHAKLVKEQPTSSASLFTVAIVDARPLLGGQAMLQALSSDGIPCIYGHLSALTKMIKRCNAVVLAAEAVGNDGSVLSQAGTALIATAAKQAGLKVHFVCESYKFTEGKAFLDAASAASSGNEMLPSVCVTSELRTRAPEVPAAAPLMTAVAARAKAAAAAASAGAGAPAPAAAAPAKPKQQQQQSKGGGGGGGDKDAIQTCASTGRFEHDAALPLAGELAMLTNPAASSAVSSTHPALTALTTSVTTASSTLSSAQNTTFNSPMGNWRRKPGLKVMALAMDVTPASAVTSILTEAGAVPPSAVWMIHSEFGKLEEAPEEEGNEGEEEGEGEEGEEGEDEEEAGAAEEEGGGAGAAGDEPGDD
jgi:translation initiation factor 2B subunit (eIF-2B alpha/beta/delta family)